MVTTKLLKDALWEIFFDKNPEFENLVVPLQGNWMLPTIGNDNPSSTWVGFTILNHRRRARATQHTITDPVTKLPRAIVQILVKTQFRVVFVGPQAEDWANTTLLWEVRGDVSDEFEREMKAQINYDDRQLYTRVYEQEGVNDTLAWVLDISAMSFFAVDTHQTPWVPIGGDGIITVP